MSATKARSARLKKSCAPLPRSTHRRLALGGGRNASLASNFHPLLSSSAMSWARSWCVRRSRRTVRTMMMAITSASSTTMAMPFMSANQCVNSSDVDALRMYTSQRRAHGVGERRKWTSYV